MDGSRHPVRVPRVHADGSTVHLADHRYLRCRQCMEYDDSIVRQMVECIKAYPGGKLEIIFGGGYLVEESV